MIRYSLFACATLLSFDAFAVCKSVNEASDLECRVETEIGPGPVPPNVSDFELRVSADETVRLGVCSSASNRVPLPSVYFAEFRVVNSQGTSARVVFSHDVVGPDNVLVAEWFDDGMSMVPSAAKRPVATIILPCRGDPVVPETFVHMRVEGKGVALWNHSSSAFFEFSGVGAVTVSPVGLYVERFVVGPMPFRIDSLVRLIGQ